MFDVQIFRLNLILQIKKNPWVLLASVKKEWTFLSILGKRNLTCGKQITVSFHPMMVIFL